MNTFYNQMFNPQYVNPVFYSQIQSVISQYEYEQDKKVSDAVKAVHDLLAAVNGMDQRHQEQAFALCLAEFAQQNNW